jgi:hypothetical protein
MVSTYCSDCYEYNEDEAAYELREMCQNLYTGAAYACETKMEYFSYYGQNVQGCDYVQENLPAAIQKAQKKGGKVFGWMVLFLVIGGGVGYVMWWRKSKYWNFSNYANHNQQHDANATAADVKARRKQLMQASSRPRWWQRLRR